MESRPCRIEVHIEKALEEQWMRLDIGANISARRMGLNQSLESFSQLLDITTKSLTRLEEGIIFRGVEEVRIKALELLERQEDKAQGKQRILRVVK